jgi:hypothetical protein
MSEPTACGYCLLPTSFSIVDICPVDCCKLADIGYSIFDSRGRALTRRAAEQVAPPQLLQFLDSANALWESSGKPKSPANCHIAIADTGRVGWGKAYCAIRTNVAVKPRGEWDLLCGLVGGGEPRFVCVDAADAPEGSPILGRVLHDFYKTEPTPPTAPPEPPTAEETAAAALRARRRAILRKLGASLFPALPLEVSEQRAMQIVYAVREYDLG